MPRVIRTSAKVNAKRFIFILNPFFFLLVTLVVINASIANNLKMDKEYLQKFANNLKKLRKEKGLTQDDLAVSEQISRSMISLIEIAKTDLTVSKVKIIADTLKVHPKELFDFD